ncbi:nucleoside 2-deoxyribosyltransferase [Patescibacteria group bacterium]|nr:nucleoside 2-deoxyribosyltransferase [Patescibacteria group bacterium]
MKITICGSMTFAGKMSEAKKELEKQGHVVFVPCDIEKHLENPALVDNFAEDLPHMIANDVIRDHFDLIEKSDAIVVLNYPKNGCDGYVGASTLMEMGVAYYLHKKIFTLFDIPASDKARWAHEVSAMQPVVLAGDLGKIK